MVSIAGGEPLVHPEVDVIAKELIARKKFVYLCTNGILMKKKLDLFEPSPYFAWVVHLDGMRERHDQFVEREGTFDKAVDAIREAKRRGFRVNTNTTFLTTDTPKTVRDVLDFLNDELKVDQMMLSPAYAYEKAPDQEHFPGVAQARRLFSEAFADGKRKRWRLNHTPLFLDFLEGKVDFQCTPWGIPSYSLFGWQRPCYLMADGYTADLQGADRDDRLVEVRARQRPTLRQLHGALRVRADRRPRLHEVGPAGLAVGRRRALEACSGARDSHHRDRRMGRGAVALLGRERRPGREERRRRRQTGPRRGRGSARRAAPRRIGAPRSSTRSPACSRRVATRRPRSSPPSPASRSRRRASRQSARPRPTASPRSRPGSSSARWCRWMPRPRAPASSRSRSGCRSG